MSETLPKQKVTLTFSAAEQQIVDELKNLQEESLNAKGKSKSDGEFCKDLEFASSTWNLIKNGKYLEKLATEKSKQDLVESLTRALRDIQQRMALTARFGTAKFHPTPCFSAVFSAISECRNKPLSDPDRNIVFLAETGGGKSALSAEIAKRFSSVIVVEARPSWKKSYYFALIDICKKIGLPIQNSREDNLERDLLTALKKRNYLIVIDEGEFFGAGVLNLLKLILNQTRTVIVICAIPGAYDNWNRYYNHEALQIKRRTHLVVEHKLINPDDVKPFLSGISLDGELKAACGKICSAANVFGRFDFVTRVVRRLRTDEEVSLEDVDKAVQVERKSLGDERSAQ